MYTHTPLIDALCFCRGGMLLDLQIGIAPTSIVGRYSCPYNNIEKTQWWDIQKSGGCIVEQATHFVDLMRYLAGGDIIQESIKATAVGPSMLLQQMPPHPKAEHLVRPSTTYCRYCLTHTCHSLLVRCPAWPGCGCSTCIAVSNLVQSCSLSSMMMRDTKRMHV